MTEKQKLKIKKTTSKDIKSGTHHDILQRVFEVKLLQDSQKQPYRVKASQHVWDQWLAGLIDADGYIGILKQGTLTCEITTDVDDEPMLREIQSRLGGRVKPRAGSASVRWRLTHLDGMRSLCQRINGHIRLNVRRKQFERACALLNIVCLPPVKLTRDSGYIAGLFDGDGSITIGVQRSSAAHSILPDRFGKAVRLSYSRGHHQLSIHIDSSDHDLLESCQKILNIGALITKQPSNNPSQRRPNVHYRWYWRSYEHVYLWQAYLRCVNARSVKHKRLMLIERYFELKNAKCHLSDPGSAMFKRWVTFCHNWFRINQNSG